jgi:hypothetical protein
LPQAEAEMLLINFRLSRKFIMLKLIELNWINIQRSKKVILQQENVQPHAAYWCMEGI